MAILEKIKNKFWEKKYLPLALAVMVFLVIFSFFVYLFAVPAVMAQSAVNSLPGVVMPQRGQKILIFSPHPDDETIGVGGYIARAVAAGADVRIVLVTDGDFHNNEQVRYSEFKKATQVLGVSDSNLVFLGFPDGKLEIMDKTSLISALKTQIEQYNPDIVICPYVKDDNPDHSTIGKTAEAILKADPYRRTVYEFLVHYKILWPRPREFAPNTHLLPPKNLLTPDVRWETFPLSQNDENLKSEAIRIYRSQNNNPWLRGLMFSSIRANELLVVPQDIYAP